MDKNSKKLDCKGNIVVRVNWDQYARQRAGGVISGLLNKESGDVDCDTSAIIVKEEGSEPKVIDTVTYTNPSAMNDMIVHHGDNAANGGEEEQISINLGCLSDDISVIITLDTLKEKKFKTGKLSHISVSIEDKEGKNILYSESFSGAGDRAMCIGRIRCDSGNYFYESDLRALNNVKEKSEIINAVLQKRK